MYEKDCQTVDFQDTTPENCEEKQTTIDNDISEVVTPGSNTFDVENVERDTDTQLAQKSVSEQENASEPFVSVRYNHQNRNFTKEEAINLIQKGMHTESLRSKLEYLAKSKGVDVNLLVENIVSAPENSYRKHLEGLYGKGSPDVEIGMKIYREQQSEEYKKIMADIESGEIKKERVNSVNNRLANEYMSLKQEIPDAPDYSALPDSVIIEAAQGKRDLYSAYLCYLHKEKQKIDAANKTKEAANAASVGKMSNTEADVSSLVDRGFLSGLWGR